MKILTWRIAEVYEQRMQLKTGYTFEYFSMIKTQNFTFLTMLKSNLVPAFSSLYSGVNISDVKGKGVLIVSLQL